MGHRPPMSAKAAGKQPVKNANDKPVNTKTFLPAPAVSSNVGFANELSEDDNGFVSRYMFISQLPDGTPAGMDRDHEFFIIQNPGYSRMTSICLKSLDALKTKL